MLGCKQYILWNFVFKQTNNYILYIRHFRITQLFLTAYNNGKPVDSGVTYGHKNILMANVVNFMDINAANIISIMSHKGVLWRLRFIFIFSFISRYAIYFRKHDSDNYPLLHVLIVKLCLRFDLSELPTNRSIWENVNNVSTSDIIRKNWRFWTLILTATVASQTNQSALGILVGVIDSISRPLSKNHCCSFIIH